jgi:hypothetical protein
MLDSIRARLRRATNRRRQADRISFTKSGYDSLTECPDRFSGLIGEPVHEPFHTRPQTVDVGSLRRSSKGFGGLDERQLAMESQLEDGVGVERPKTSQSGVRLKLEGRRSGKTTDVLKLKSASGWVARESTSDWEIALKVWCINWRGL